MSIWQEYGRMVTNFPTRAINGGEGGHCSAVGGNAPDSKCTCAEQNDPFTIPGANAESIRRVAQGLQRSIGKRNLFELVIIDKTNETAVRRPEYGPCFSDLRQRFGYSGIQGTDPDLSFAFDGGDKGQSAPIR